jgi:hypothetical protein
MAKHRDSENSRKEKTIHQKKRKQYLKPELVIYGHVEKLTEGNWHERRFWDEKNVIIRILR